ncbi:MAG: hypothetical protein IKO78_04080 [Bacilli bacterium]|nr:hypothetical protein [Bacilli bacterium]
MNTKKLLGLFCTFALVFFLTACGGKEASKAVQLCDKIEPKIEKAKNGDITYQELYDDIMATDYKEFCPDNDNAICTSVKAMKLISTDNSEVTKAKLSEMNMLCTLEREK